MAHRTVPSIPARVRTWPSRHVRLLTILAVLVLWQTASLFFHGRDLPGLVRLAANVHEVVVAGRFDFVENVSITVQRMTLGFSVAFVLGSALGIAMGSDRRVRAALTAPVITFLTFPAVVWAFLAIMWWGVTEYLVFAFVIAAGALPYVTVTVWKGTESVGTDLREMAAVYDASTLQRWRHVHVPHLTPFLYSSARIGFAISWKISLIAEVFGATAGVGYVVNVYFESLRSDMIVAWSLPIMLLMYGVEVGLRQLEERSFEWRPDLERPRREVEA